MASYRILRTSDEAQWNAALAPIVQKALVHFPRYARVYERYGDGTAECFVYEDGSGVVLYPYMRRTIPDAPGLTDIVTPYGYGGIVYDCPPESTARLIKDFRRAFTDHALETKTVCEFVRFHPYLGNHEHLVGLMDDVTLHCENAFLDLRVGKDALFRGYRERYRTYIRKAESAGVTVEIAGVGTFIDAFSDFYRTSMASKGQKGYFNFRREFVDILAQELPHDVLSVAARQGADMLCVAFFLRSGHFLDYFLVAPNLARLELRPNHLLIHKVAFWAIDNGFHFMQLGGGHPSLQFFKQGFSNLKRPYYVGKHVFDREAYARLSTEHWRRHNAVWTPEQQFFPAYRAERPGE
ncbi:MAG: GNAT family N-acetyltransferase [Rhodospirillales bacterium]|nr:GNAT family N-acetyltransferase [Rhodospirillales bacterium]